jgi:hypothetical protein
VHPRENDKTRKKQEKAVAIHAQLLSENASLFSDNIKWSVSPVLILALLCATLLALVLNREQ